MVNEREHGKQQGRGVCGCVSKKREEKKKEQELGSFFHFSPIQGKDFKVIPCLFLHSLLYTHTTTIPPSPLSLISFVPFYQLYSLSIFSLSLCFLKSPPSAEKIFSFSLSLSLSLLSLNRVEEDAHPSKTRLSLKQERKTPDRNNINPTCLFFFLLSSSFLSFFLSFFNLQTR